MECTLLKSTLNVAAVCSVFSTVDCHGWVQLDDIFSTEVHPYGFRASERWLGSIYITRLNDINLLYYFRIHFAEFKRE